MQIDIARSEYLEQLKSYYGDNFINNNTFYLEGKTVTEVWSNYCNIQRKVKK